MSSARLNTSPGNSPASAISNLVVRLMSEYTGRGPTRARTYIHDDLITVLLQDTLTKGERSLVRDGKEELVLTTRLAFQMTMREDLTAGLEQITGRKVRAFMSSNHMDPDVASKCLSWSRLSTRRNRRRPRRSAAGTRPEVGDSEGLSLEDSSEVLCRAQQMHVGEMHVVAGPGRGQPPADGVLGSARCSRQPVRGVASLRGRLGRAPMRCGQQHQPTIRAQLGTGQQSRHPEFPVNQTQREALRCGLGLGHKLLAAQTRLLQELIGDAVGVTPRGYVT